MHWTRLSRKQRSHAVFLDAFWLKRGQSQGDGLTSNSLGANYVDLAIALLLRSRDERSWALRAGGGSCGVLGNTKS